MAILKVNGWALVEGEDEMSTLKVGDWVLVDGEVGQVTVADFTKGTHLIKFKGKGRRFANATQETRITKIDPAFHKLLTDVYKESDDD
jgi:hypothetical protein